MSKSKSSVAFSEHCAEILRYVADNIGEYLPDETLLEGTELVVRVGDRNTIPVVELDATMPVMEMSFCRNTKPQVNGLL